MQPDFASAVRRVRIALSLRHLERTSPLANQLIPPPELSPSVRSDLTMAERVQAWFELMQISEQFLLAGIRHRIGPDGDLQQAVRQWYEQEMEQHGVKNIHLLKELARREKGEASGH